MIDISTNGYLKIKTKIDNSGIDKDIKSLEDKIKKVQLENAGNSEEQSALEKEISNYEELCAKADEYNNKIKQLNVQKQGISKQFDGNIPSSEVGSFSQINSQISTMQLQYAKATQEIDSQAPRIDKIYKKLDKIKAKQIENNSKIAQYKNEIDQINFNKAKSGIDSIGKGVQQQIGKISKMALAVIGIRTAWEAVRGAISLVSQYNSQVSADFEYMKYCIANLLTPVIQGLVKLLYTLLSYVNAISVAWFGINLFGNSSVKSFQKMQSSAGSTAKSAKEIQKSLQGFDEMNIISDTSSNTGSNGGGGSGGVSTPSMDLSGMQGEIPGWLQWIIDNKDLVISGLAGIAAGLVALKLGFTGVQAIGIGVAVAGIVSTIQNIIKFIRDPSWSNFANVLLSISVVLAGIALVVGGTLGTTIASIAGLIAGIALIIQGVISYLNDPTWENFITILGGIALAVGAVLLLIGGIPALITGIILLVAAIGLAIATHWQEIQEILGQVAQWIYDNVITPVGNFIKTFLDSIVSLMWLLLNTINRNMYNNWRNNKCTIYKCYRFCRRYV